MKDDNVLWTLLRWHLEVFQIQQWVLYVSINIEVYSFLEKLDLHLWDCISLLYTEKRIYNYTLPVNPILTGRSSVDCSINCIWHGDVVQVVARVPSAGPVPPPTSVVIPEIRVIWVFRDIMLQNKTGSFSTWLRGPINLYDCEVIFL